MSTAVAVREKPIIFSAPMVRAITDGRKTVTRRIIKPQPEYHDFGPGGVQPAFVRPQTIPALLAVSVSAFNAGSDPYVKCPYRPGDHLWVREAFRDWMPCGCERDSILIEFRESPWNRTLNGVEVPKWRPSIHMPRWASRITLAVVSVRPERLHDITEEDALAEGCDPWPHDPQQPMTSGELGSISPYRGGFACLWDDLHAEGPTWKDNPWVWRIEFRRLNP